MKKSTVIDCAVAVVISFLITVDGATLTCTQNDPTGIDPIVSTKQGFVRGSVASSKNRQFFAFKGVPYAEPPIEKLRFNAPVPKSSWSGTLNATEDVKSCVQWVHLFDYSEVSGNEDCLYLNVFAPQLPSDRDCELLPVIFHIHGGAYSWLDNNSTRYDPKLLMDKDVILVIPNYRLGAFGFLSTGDEVASGNWGLKDQLLALQWTRDNIRNFGGDPEKITLMGDSAGGASAHLLTLTDQARGLARGLVTMSGNAYIPSAQHRYSSYSNLAFKLGEKLGCPIENSIALVDCLRKLDAAEVQTGSASLRESVKLSIPLVTWGPCVEPKIEGALLTDTVENLITAKKQSDMPWMNTGVPNEGFILTAQFHKRPNLFDELLADFDHLYPYAMSFIDSDMEQSSITAAVKAYYLKNLEPNMDKSTLLKNLTDSATDGHWMYPVSVAMEDHVTRLSSPAYHLSFEYRGTFSKSYIWTEGLTDNFGVVHQDDLLYIFPMHELYLPEMGLELSEDDIKIQDIMIQLLVSFVTDGEPSTVGLNINWDPYSCGENYLRVGSGSSSELSIGYAQRAEQINFWRKASADANTCEA